MLLQFSYKNNTYCILCINWIWIYNFFSLGIPLGPDPGIALVKERLSDVKYKVLILSGKGGVGKSTFSALLGRALAAKFPEKNVSISNIFLYIIHFIFYI